MANIPQILGRHNDDARNILNLTIETVNTMDGTVTKAKNDINNFINGTGVVTRQHLAANSVDGNALADETVFTRHVRLGAITDDKIADSAVTTPKVRDGAIDRNKIADAAIGPSQIDNSSVTSSKIVDNAIGRRHILDNTINAEKVLDESLGSSELSVDTVTMNKGKNYPLINYDVDGAETAIVETHKMGILDAKVTGADLNKVYRLSSIRNGYNGSYGMNVDSFDLDKDRNIDTTTQKRVISHATSVYPTFFTYNYGKTVGTITAHRSDGLVVTVTFDVAEVGDIINLAENSLGSSQGAVIDPSKYEYKIVAESEESSNYNDHVVVDKSENEMKVFVKSHGNIYTGYQLYRVTMPWQEGNQQSNIDLWSIGRVSTYTREGNIFIEDDNKVFVYSNISQPTYTNDTIFRLDGASDYSGGLYHGDEKIQTFYISVGNADITSMTGQFDGESVELMQHTHLYRDTSTSTDGSTTAFMSVKKTLRFSKKDGYTLKTKLEALENFTPTFSSIGGWQMNRTFENGADNNITDAFDLTNIGHVNLRASDSVDKHFTGQNTTDYKIVGYFKDIVMHYESDSDYFDTWLRNWAENEMKIYSQVFEPDVQVTAGTVVNASVNYKITSY